MQKYSFFHRDFSWFENDSSEWNIENYSVHMSGKNHDPISVKKCKKLILFQVVWWEPYIEQRFIYQQIEKIYFWFSFLLVNEDLFLPGNQTTKSVLVILISPPPTMVILAHCEMGLFLQDER